MITTPFFKPVEDGTRKELLTYIGELRANNEKIAEMYNDIERKYIEQEIKINNVFILAEQIKEKIMEGYPKYNKKGK